MQLWSAAREHRFSDHVAVTWARATGAAALLLCAAGCGGTHASAVARHLVYLAGEQSSSASVWIADTNGAHPRNLGRGSAAVLSPELAYRAVSSPSLPGVDTAKRGSCATGGGRCSLPSPGVPSAEARG